MTVPHADKPIFVHASARGGSTYIFNVLRRLDPLICFNEPFNDQFGTVLTQKTIGRYQERWDTNQRFLEKSAYHEYIAAWDAVMPRYRNGMGVRDYLPRDGALPDGQRAYLAGFLDYASAVGKRPALCQTESQGRAGAMRDAFGGYHVTQLRDPLSQWGSLYRLLEDDGVWWFLVLPLIQIGVNGRHPLYRLVPEAWRLPELLWPEEDRWQRLATQIAYIQQIRGEGPRGLERAFRLHMYAWMLNATASVAYSDLVLDIDRVHDDPRYRSALAAALQAEIGMAPDFSDITQFARYVDCAAFDMAAVSAEILESIRSALADGRLEGAVRTLARGSPRIPVVEAAGIVCDKLEASLRSMAAAPGRRRVSNEDWARTARSRRQRWEDPRLR